jgi:hypothetical protein
MLIRETGRLEPWKNGKGLENFYLWHGTDFEG